MYGQCLSYLLVDYILKLTSCQTQIDLLNADYGINVQNYEACPEAQGLSVWLLSVDCRRETQALKKHAHRYVA